ncbi:MAG TPA: biotin carboxylase, partial [Cyanobacteria bacterium UBA11148]|nr:biotin carboxylase [Cyanobacteria bacterium UBA11148]
REVVRDFISILNILQQNPQIAFHDLIQDSNFKSNRVSQKFDSDGDSEFAEFTL